MVKFHLTNNTQLIFTSRMLQPKGLCQLFTRCKQLTKIFGLKCPPIEYYQQLCIAHQVNFTTSINMAMSLYSKTVDLPMKLFTQYGLAVRLGQLYLQIWTLCIRIATCTTIRT